MTAEKLDGCIKLSVAKITEEPAEAESKELSGETVLMAGSL